ncbi:transposase [Marinospirillum sp.]|uniref:transposase n=1 Tax=Marinospirillum sp. TaxID=2183934 RepID=UPI0028707191|nr:transposase [Marinospirillum sp.]MDR9466776.1 transposase [Marinospirillum sp.]
MPRYNNPKKTRQYSFEFKRKAVEMSQEPGVQVQEVAQRLGIHPFMLSRWRKEYREGLYPLRSPPKGKSLKKTRKPAKPDSDNAELKKLRKENSRLKLEVDLLKKWQRFLAEQRRNATDS